MDKFLEITKSSVAFVAFSALVAITLVAVSALNPVSKVVLFAENQNVAGLQQVKAQTGSIYLKGSSQSIRLTNSTAEFDIFPSQTNVKVGQITLTNSSEVPGFIYISAVLPGNIQNLVRVELLDEDNKIILSDYSKNFEKQKISFSKQSSRTFTVRYLLKNPINYSSKVTLNLL